ncbi:MAG: hypothetical protein OHK93_006912 [Ramalina farinacea]|uniref:arginine--tRNA ligase n=1 Tax=Ramalina farinacea TaxID=258253 RepID=A0AA43QKV8_9LECA|nr:hypothetical protein [Ramalina farinacea]
MSTTEIASLEAQLQKLDVSTPIPPYNAADFLVNPIDIYRAYLADTVAAILPIVNPQLVYDSIQWTNNPAHGDLIVVTPKLRLKGTKPAEIVVNLVSKFPPSKLFSKPTASGIHLQVCFSPETLPQLLIPYILDRRSAYGSDAVAGLRDRSKPTSAKKKIIVEFSSPNIAKEFHAGHLRSTIIGAYISNLYKIMGWEVVNMNYLGDWGKQFGLVAIGWERFGSEEAFKNHPLSHLLEVYVKASALFKKEKEKVEETKARKEDTSELESQGIFAERDAFFSRLEAREPDALALWRRFRDISIQRYTEVYARLNTFFDDYSGESQIDPKTIDKVQRLLTEKGVLEESNGALLIDFKKHGAKKMDVAIVRNRQGTSTYLLRDLAAVLEREEKYGFDKIIYVVSSEQDMYLQRLFKSIELMGFNTLASKLQHINFGKVQGMSSRMGKVELLGDILDKCGEKTHEKMKENEVKYKQVEDPVTTADTVGISAMMVQDMTGKRVHDYPFDFERMTSFEGDTGPYLQYSHARLCSIMRKSGYTNEDLQKADLSLLREKAAIETLRLLAQYPDVTHTAFKNLEPTTIVGYLFKLTHQISSGYDNLRVVDIREGRDVSIARAAYYDCARQVMFNALSLLGIKPVERYALEESLRLGCITD